MAKKKESWGWGLAKFGLVAAGGAVVGAFALRAVDNYFIGKYGRAPFTGAGGGDGDDVDAVESNPRVQPQAIAPVIPMFPGMTMAPTLMGTPPVLHITGSGHAAVPSSIEEPMPRGNPRRRSSEEERAKREDDFEKLVARFESGDI